MTRLTKEDLDLLEVNIRLGEVPVITANWQQGYTEVRFASGVCYFLVGWQPLVVWSDAFTHPVPTKSASYTHYLEFGLNHPLDVIQARREHEGFSRP